MANGPSCPHVERCELFPRLRTAGALSYCLYAYCHGEFETCARFQFAKEHRRPPPLTLLPNGGRHGAGSEEK